MHPQHAGATGLHALHLSPSRAPARDRSSERRRDPSRATATRWPPPLAPHVALFLDFEGALTEFAPGPEGIVVPEHVSRLLWSLRSYLGGAVALISARSLRVVEELLGSTPITGAGRYGAELRTAPDEDVAVVGVEQLAVLETLVRERFSDDPRIVVEAGDAAVAVHFRGAPKRATQCLTVVSQLAARFQDLDVVRGNLVVEARPRGTDKGRALRRLMARPPFHGRPPVYVGQDPHDESAFDAVKGLRGYGVTVGWSPSHARYRCSSATDLYAWLSDSVHPQ